MNEPPGSRFRVGHAALTMAEYFRDETRQDVLLLIDNIFRFIQAGSEVSGLMGQLPSRLGYQPTLATELAELEERICSTASGAITSVQAVYVPADDFSDPAAVHTFSHLVGVHCAVAQTRERRALSGHRSVALRIENGHAADCGRAALSRRAGDSQDAGRLRGAEGHHRHARPGGAIAGRSADGSSRTAPGTFLDAAVFRHGAIHRTGRQAGAASRTRSTAASAFSTTNSPIFPEQALYMIGAIREARKK